MGNVCCSSREESENKQVGKEDTSHADTAPEKPRFRTSDLKSTDVASVLAKASSQHEEIREDLVAERLLNDKFMDAVLDGDSADLNPMVKSINLRGTHMR